MAAAAAMTAPVVRLAASKVALLAGLHEFGDVGEAMLEYVFQDREELLAEDARALQLRVVSRDDALGELVALAGASLAKKLSAVLQWTRVSARDAQPPPSTSLRTAQALAANVDNLVASAQRKRRLNAEQAQDVKRQLRERIRLSVGVRNEDAALKQYEAQCGCQVRLTNASYYFLSFPSLPLEGDGNGNLEAVDFAALEARIQRSVIATRRRGAHAGGGGEASDDAHALGPATEYSWDSDEEALVDHVGDDGEASERERTYFTICGMVDGVTDALEIASPSTAVPGGGRDSRTQERQAQKDEDQEDKEEGGDDDEDDWHLVPIVVEVKNRMRAFRVPPPLHDHIQMAVYMKMLDVTAGDLVQCLHTDRASIHVSRISMAAYPLALTTKPMHGNENGSGWSEQASGLWATVLLPRLYTVVQTIETIRQDETLRHALLQASEAERLAIVRAFCDFL